MNAQKKETVRIIMVPSSVLITHLSLLLQELSSIRNSENKSRENGPKSMVRLIPLRPMEVHSFIFGGVK